MSEIEMGQNLRKKVLYTVLSGVLEYRL